MDKDLISAVAELDEDKVLFIVNQLIARGRGKEEILSLLQLGMEEVGRMYERGDYFIADLILSGIIFRSVLDLKEMHFTPVEHAIGMGKILIGTAEGDVHDIGKDMVISVLRANGYDVVDLGTDVTAERFAKKTRQVSPDIVAISGVMTFAVKEMKRTIDLLKKEGLRDTVKIMVGGTCINKSVSEEIGADAFSSDPLDGLEICHTWLSVQSRDN